MFGVKPEQFEYFRLVSSEGISIKELILTPVNKKGKNILVYGSLSFRVKWERKQSITTKFLRHSVEKKNPIKGLPE